MLLGHLGERPKKRKVFQNDLVQKMLILTRRHFANEQRLMLDYRYEMTVHHASEHQKMMAAFTDMVINFDIHGADRITAFFEKWLIDHLFNEDLRMARWIQFYQCLGLTPPQ